MGMWGATSLERSCSSAMRGAYPLLAFKLPTLDGQNSIGADTTKASVVIHCYKNDNG